MDACEETQHQKGVCIITWKVFYFPLSHMGCVLCLELFSGHGLIVFGHLIFFIPLYPLFIPSSIHRQISWDDNDTFWTVLAQSYLISQPTTPSQTWYPHRYQVSHPRLTLHLWTGPLGLLLCPSWSLFALDLSSTTFPKLQLNTWLFHHWILFPQCLCLGSWKQSLGAGLMSMCLTGGSQEKL